MDPNATLEEMLGAARSVIDNLDNDVVDHDLLELEANELAERVIALDEWLTSGGFMPSRWSKEK